MGRGVCYNVKFEKRVKKFCDNCDRKKGLHQMATAIVPGGKIMCGLNSLHYFFYIFQDILKGHILLFFFFF